MLKIPISFCNVLKNKERETKNLCFYVNLISVDIFAFFKVEQ